MKKLIIAILALSLLFTFAACGGGDNGGGDNGGGAAAKEVTEISHSIVWDKGTITMKVEKNEDDTPKYDFSEDAPENIIDSDYSFFLDTDIAEFGFTAERWVYNTATDYKAKYGEVPASFDGYLDWLENDAPSYTADDAEVLNVGDRGAVRFPCINGSPSDYEFYGYRYMIAADDIAEGNYVEVLVVYPDGASEKNDTPELDAEVLEMIESIVLTPAAG